jgi:hypothetical protein
MGLHLPRLSRFAKNLQFPSIPPEIHGTSEHTTKHQYWRSKSVPVNLSVPQQIQPITGTRTEKPRNKSKKHKTYPSGVI